MSGSALATNSDNVGAWSEVLSRMVKQMIMFNKSGQPDPEGEEAGNAPSGSSVSRMQPADTSLLTQHSSGNRHWQIRYAREREDTGMQGRTLRSRNQESRNVGSRH